MNKAHYFLIILSLAFFPSLSFAQAKQQNIVEQLQGLRNRLERKSALQRVKSKTARDDSTIAKELGVDLETARMVQSLENPFISQLPRPKKPVQNELPPPDEDIPVEIIPDSEGPQIDIEPRRPAEPKFSISGIVWNTDRPQAILNGQIVDVGDTFDNWTIVDITREGVKVRLDEYTYMVEP